jgi:predicted DNA-binding transcriptional regulator AlpA
MRGESKERVDPDDGEMQRPRDLEETTDRLLTPSDLCEELSISRATLYRILGRDAAFPDPIYLSPRLPRWRRTDLDRWLNARRRNTELLHIRPELLGGPKRRGPARRGGSRSA